MAGVRQTQRAETTAHILQSARRQIAEQGTVSMRAVARDVDMVSSAVFRYFPTREALLTAMIVESYGSVARAIGSAVQAAPDGQAWRDGGRALRQWARARPHEFQLIYGTPLPGYQAPPETIPAAAAAAEPMLEQCVDAEAGIAELAQLIGFVGLELAGHFVGAISDPDALYERILGRQVEALRGA